MKNLFYKKSYFEVNWCSKSEYSEILIIFSCSSFRFFLIFVLNFLFNSFVIFFLNFYLIISRTFFFVLKPFFIFLTSLSTRFLKGLQKLFHIDSEWLRSRDWKSLELRCSGYFCHILFTDFLLKITSFSALLCRKFYFFNDKNINTPCIPPYKLLWSSG